VILTAVNKSNNIAKLDSKMNNLDFILNTFSPFMMII